MAGLRETSGCSTHGEEHDCNVYSAQWFWMRKHLGGLRASSRPSFAEADLSVTSARQTMMSFDVNTQRSLNAINGRHNTPTQKHQLLTWYFHHVQLLFKFQSDLT